MALAETVTDPNDQATEAVGGGPGDDTDQVTDTGTDDQDAAADAPDSTTPAQADDDESDDGGEAPEELVSDEEYEALKANPEALRHKLQAAFTQKTQEIAPLRKFFKQLQADPDGTIKALARLRGIDLGGGAKSAGKVDPATALQNRLAEVLGPEAARVFHPLIGDLVKHHVAPLEQELTQLRAHSVAETNEQVVAAFSDKHPGWERYETAMTEIARRLEPHGMNATEYMETLYALATKGIGVAQSTRKIIEKINRSAAVGKTGRVAGTSSAGVSAKSSASGKLPTLEEAVAAALRGERLFSE